MVSRAVGEELIVGQHPLAEEQLTRCISDALRQSGYPPLQFLNVESRDGHVYLSARVPELFLTRRNIAAGTDFVAHEG